MNVNNNVEAISEMSEILLKRIYKKNLTPINIYRINWIVLSPKSKWFTWSAPESFKPSKKMIRTWDKSDIEKIDIFKWLSVNL